MLLALHLFLFLLLRLQFNLSLVKLKLLPLEDTFFRKFVLYNSVPSIKGGTSAIFLDALWSVLVSSSFSRYKPAAILRRRRMKSCSLFPYLFSVRDETYFFAVGFLSLALIFLIRITFIRQEVVHKLFDCAKFLQDTGRSPIICVGALSFAHQIEKLVAYRL